MKISKKFLNESEKRFMLRTTSNILLKEFISNILQCAENYDVTYCENISDFMKDFSRGELFDYTPHVIVLMELTKDDIKPMLNAFKLETEDILVIVERSSLLRSKEYTNLKSVCDFFEIKDPDTRSCGARARRWLNDAGISFVEGVPQHIVQKKGNDLEAIKNEIDKLALIYNGLEITPDFCDKVISGLADAKMFEFMDFFFKKRMKEALDEFKKIPENTYIKFLHFIIGQINRIYKVAIYKDQGLGAGEISEMIGVPTFIVKTKLFTATSFYSKIKLIQVLDLLNVLDFELRVSKHSKDLLFESYLIKAMKL